MSSSGLPLPGPAGEGIATLSQVVADPKLLRQLDLEGGPAYPVGESQLKQVVALIDVEPAAASRRMAILEKGLASSQRIDLALEPSKLQSQLAKHQEIAVVSLWRVPLEAAFYAARQNERRSARHENERELSIFRMTAPVDDVLMGEGNPLTWGRNLQLQGRLQSTENERVVGARTLYMESRRPDQEIEALATSPTAQRAYGLTAKLPKDEKFRQQVLDRQLELSRRAKQHATYWLSLTYCDDGKYDTAAEWLDERTLHAPLPSPWAAGALYNLARCYEQLGRWDDARQLLAEDDSPQKHGNQLRAKSIAQRHSK